MRDCSILKPEYRIFILYDNVEICLSSAYNFFTKLDIKQHDICIDTYTYNKTSFLKNYEERTHPKNSQANQLHAQDTRHKIHPLSMPVTTPYLPPNYTPTYMHHYKHIDIITVVRSISHVHTPTPSPPSPPPHAHTL